MSSPEVGELLERRAQVQTWLERLEAQRGTVSDRALERVREDYEGRLRDTLEALRSHREAIEGELAEARSRLGRAEERREEAEERLEERALRQTIGEITPEEWATERDDLEREVATAARGLEAARQEQERLESLLRQLGEGEAASHIRSEPPAPAAMGREAAPPADRPLSPPPAEATFLADVGGAFDAEGDDEMTIVPAPTAAGDEEPSEETAPKPGLKCTECGYTNDLSAWFCGVCGADVG